MKFSQQQKQLEANGKYFISNILFQPPPQKKSQTALDYNLLKLINGYTLMLGAQ